VTAYLYWHFVHKRKGLPPGLVLYIFKSIEILFKVNPSARILNDTKTYLDIKTKNPGIHLNQPLILGPTPWPIFGNLLEVLRDPPGEAVYSKWSKKYGDVYTYWMGTFILIELCVFLNTQKCPKFKLLNYRKFAYRLRNQLQNNNGHISKRRGNICRSMGF
jgi:hypothetical protein